MGTQGLAGPASPHPPATAARAAGGLFLIAVLEATTIPVALAQDGDPAPAPSRVLEEIIVTATRRAENVQELPSSIRVFDEEALEKIGAEGFDDYVFRVPGADVVDTGADRKLAIRGVGNVTTRGNGAGASTSPIGLYLNDTPIQGNGTLPDLDLYDLERIEVLKGPQGTLYG